MLKYIWLAIFVILLIIEGLGPGLICIWFAFGAIVSFIFSLFNASLVAQIIAFIVSSALFVVLLRPIAVRYINQRRVATNADAVIGHEGVVIEEINGTLGKGQVKIMGQVWTAKSDSDDILPVDSLVKVLRIEGAKVIVELIR